MDQKWNKPSNITQHPNPEEGVNIKLPQTRVRKNKPQHPKSPKYKKLMPKTNIQSVIRESNG